MKEPLSLKIIIKLSYLFPRAFHDYLCMYNSSERDLSHNLSLNSCSSLSIEDNNQPNSMVMLCKSLLVVCLGMKADNWRFTPIMITTHIFQDESSFVYTSFCVYCKLHYLHLFENHCGCWWCVYLLVVSTVSVVMNIYEVHSVTLLIGCVYF